MQSVQRLNDLRTGIKIVDHGNPSAWHGTPTTVTVVHPNDSGGFRWDDRSPGLLFGRILGRALRDFSNLTLTSIDLQ